MPVPEACGAVWEEEDEAEDEAAEDEAAEDRDKTNHSAFPHHSGLPHFFLRVFHQKGMKGPFVKLSNSSNVSGFTVDKTVNKIAQKRLNRN